MSTKVNIHRTTGNGFGEKIILRAILEYPALQAIYTQSAVIADLLCLARQGSDFRPGRGKVCLLSGVGMSMQRRSIDSAVVLSTDAYRHRHMKVNGYH